MTRPATNTSELFGFPPANGEHPHDHKHPFTTPPKMSDSARRDDGFSTPRTWRHTAQSVLTRLSHGSAPFVTTFVLIHLTAPVMANLGGTSLSSQVMVSARRTWSSGPRPVKRCYSLVMWHPTKGSSGSYTARKSISLMRCGHHYLVGHEARSDRAGAQSK